MKSTEVPGRGSLILISLLGLGPVQADTTLEGHSITGMPASGQAPASEAATTALKWFDPGRPMRADPVSDYGGGAAGLTNLATGDLNNDGHPDIAAAHGYRKAGIYLHNGGRTFAPERVLSERWWPVAANIGATSVATGDLDQDGNLDLVIPLYGAHYRGHMAQLYRGHGDGTFEIWPVDGYNDQTKREGSDGIDDGIIAAQGAANPMFPLIADFNGDELPDVALSGNNGSWSVDILTQSANQQFTVSNVNRAGQNPQYMALADFNEDGYPDVAAGALYNGVLVFLNDGNAQGTLHQAGGAYLSPHHHFLVTADFNGDGHQDIAVRALREKQVDILYGNGNGLFPTTAHFAVSGIDGYLAAANIDHDDHTDLVVASVSTQSVDLLLNDGSGGFAAPVSTILTAAPWGITAADFDGDDRVDVAVARADNTVQVLWNVGRGLQEAPTAVSVSPSVIHLAWLDATGENGYRIERKRGQCDSNDPWVVRADTRADVSMLLDIQLLPSTTYSYRVSADIPDRPDQVSPCASVTTAAAGTPHMPMNLRAASRSDMRIDLQWQDASKDETAFEIYRWVGTGNWTLLVSLPAGTQSYSDSAATGNTATVSHSYDVRACNTSGCSSPNLPVVVPFRPSNLEVIWNSAARLTWQDNSSNERSFHVQRRNGDCASDTPWLTLKILSGNRQAYTDRSTVPGTAYAYRVLAFSRTDEPSSNVGRSRPTNCVAATTP